MVEESRRTQFVFKDLNNTFLELIPKKGERETFNDFRPIALCNIVNKVIANVIDNRLKMVLSTIISPEQSGFAPGKSIYEGIIIAHEAIHSLKSNKDPGMLLKLDISKAYDNVNRCVLMRILEKFGFGDRWCKWISSCIDSPRISILVNGSPQGFFDMKRGMHQGDPLSPFLFIILVEALKRSIVKSNLDGRWKGLKVARGVDAITHLQFVDANFLMGEASIKEADNIKTMLEDYSKVTSQKVNWRKSEIFFFNTPSKVKTKIC